MSDPVADGTGPPEGWARALWASGAAVLWLDAAFALQGLNGAAASLLQRPAAPAGGQPLTAWMPPGEHESWTVQLAELGRASHPWPLLRARLTDGAGHERGLVFTPVGLAPAAPGWLFLLHDESPEQVARVQARRAEDEMAQWFELSGAGMAVVDGTGLIVRANAAFEALVPGLPEVLPQGSPELQRLLGWQDEGLDPALQPGHPPLERQVLMPAADGRRRRLWSRLSCQAGEGGTLRVRAVVQDRSAEDERDIARLEMGMLMDTASVRVATYDPSRGWLGGRVAAAGGGGQPSEGDALHVGIRSDLVAPASRADFERLQAALRSGQPAQERYAVSHPQLGMRWLLTRVEPAQLRGGGQTMSVVTLDITEEERALRRNDQLLRELTVILDSSTAGIAYLRGPVLVRCNRRFERMLGFEPGAAAGASLQEILGRGIGPLDGVREALEALAAGRPFEAELPLVQADGVPHWYSLSVRRADGADQQGEAVAVLTDISRLKAQQAQLEQLLRDRDLMFNLSEVGIVYQRGARIERANQAMAELTGWAGPELGTLDVAELYENARECVDFEARVQQALRDGGRFVGERRLRRRDGRLIWVQVAVRPVDADDAEAGLICSFVDIDERRRARETLSQQAERTRAVLNSVLVGIVSVSDRGIEWMNRSARRMFGGELADFVGEPISTVATPEPDHPLRRADWLMRLKEGQAESFECRLRGRDGREFWVVGNAVLTGPGGAGDETGEVTFALLDIERRRQAEVSIAAAQASLQRVIETAPLAIALFDARTLRVQQANQTAGTFFGRPTDELPGSVPETCCPPAKAQTLRQWLTGVVDGDGPRQVEWRDEPAAAEGAAATVWDCRLAVLSDAGGQPAQVLLVASDVTEQRAAELARLQAAIAQREVLVREVHHRIKNNLQGVAGLLQQNAQRHPELALLLGEAVGQVHAIAQVYGLQVGSQGPLAVAGLLRAIAGSVQRTFGRGITVGLDGEVPHELPETEAIPVALTLNELMTNAIKHGQGGDVDCTLAAQGDEVTLSVSGAGRLPPGFDLGSLRGGLSGLGLVRALLPRRSAGFELVQQGDRVTARVTLKPPSVRLPEPVDR